MDLYVAKNRRRTARLRLAANSNASRGAMGTSFEAGASVALFPRLVDGWTVAAGRP